MNQSMRHFAWNPEILEFLAGKLQNDPKLQLMLPLIHVHDDFPRWCKTGKRFANEIDKFMMIYDTICGRRYNLDAEQKELCISLSCLRHEASNTDASSSRIAAFAQHIANRRVLRSDLENAQRINSMNFQLSRRFSYHKEKAMSEQVWNNLFHVCDIPQKEAIQFSEP